MSHRVSGHPGRPKLAIRAALLLSTLGLVAGPLAPLAAAAAGDLSVTTPFPSVVVEPGNSATFKLNLLSQSAGEVKLQVQNAPDGWTTRFNGGGLNVDSAFVEAKKAAEVDLDVDVPDTAPDGVTGLRVIATQGTDVVTLPVQVRVAAKSGGEITLTTDNPALSGPQSQTFSFNLQLKNGTGTDQTFSFDAQGADPTWTVSAKPAGESQAVSTVVKAGASTTVTATAQAPDGTNAGTYPFVVTATADGKTTEADLQIQITGSFTVNLSTPDQVLSTTANAGSLTNFTVRVTNNGTAPITNVTPSATAPTGWTVTFDPVSVPSVAAGQNQDFTAKITPTGDAITGDYNVVMTAKAAEATSDGTTIRVTVQTPAYWWIAGVVLIVLVFAALYWVFRTYGRR